MIELFECTICGELLKDEEFETIEWRGKEYGVCPECLKKLVSDEAVRQLSDMEIHEMEEEERADEIYDERRIG